MYPLKFRPILKSVVWGGEKIAPFKEITTDQHNIGESWELSGVKGNESVVANGEYAGRTITELVHEFKGRLIGQKNYEKTGDQFPLLIKFIDAKQDLSIQVHPDDELAAARHNGSKGKTEMWYVVAADKDAHLMSGLTQKITPDEYEQRVNNHTITDVLHDYKVAPGDVFFLPAGRIHSIGSGSFIAEIQQTSAIDYTVYPDYKTSYEKETGKENVLVDCSYFTTSMYELDSPLTRDLKDMDSFLVVICIAGKGTLKDAEGNEVTMHQGETVLVPADCTAVTFTPEGGRMQLLTSYVK